MSEVGSLQGRARFRRFNLKRAGAMRFFFFGMVAPLCALSVFLRRGDLWRGQAKALIGEMLMALVLLSGGSIVALLAWKPVSRFIWSPPEATLALVFWQIFSIFVGMILLLLTAVFALILLRGLAGPLLERLSRAVETDWFDGLAGRGSTVLDGLKSLPSVIGLLLGRLVKFLGLSLPIMLLAAIPVVGPLLAVCGEFTLVGTFLAMAVLDIPLERRDYGRLDTLAFLKRCLPGVIGLGLVMNVMVLIPFVNLLSLPLGIIGGTLLILVMEDVGALPKVARELMTEAPEEALSATPEVDQVP